MTTLVNVSADPRLPLEVDADRLAMVLVRADRKNPFLGLSFRKSREQESVGETQQPLVLEGEGARLIPLDRALDLLSREERFVRIPQQGLDCYVHPSAIQKFSIRSFNEQPTHLTVQVDNYGVIDTDLAPAAVSEIEQGIIP